MSAYVRSRVSAALYAGMTMTTLGASDMGKRYPVPARGRVAARDRRHGIVTLGG